MDPESIVIDSEVQYPMLWIPKKCLSLVILATGSEVTEDFFIDLNITSADSEGNDRCIYSGYCNVKLVDTYDGGLQPAQMEPEILDYTIENSTPIVITEPGISDPSLNQSHVWIDPDRSSSVYNHYEQIDPQERYSIRRQTKTSRITFEKRGSYITQNIYNFEESIRYSPVEEYEHKKFKKIHGNDQSIQNSDQNNLNLEDDELECGVFLSQLPEEIMHEKENKARDERRFIDIESKNNALKQLMSPDIQSLSKQTKTILFLGQDSQCGQTIQNITVNDPLVECSTSKDNFDVIFEEGRNPNQKKYQCNNCKQIFDQLSAFKQHMSELPSHPRHRSPRYYEDSNVDSEVNFLCTQCGKNLKTREKFERHCEGHGNPDLECTYCHKVFASKFTLRTHKQIHERKYPCDYCFKAFSRRNELRDHAAKAHNNMMFICDKCNYIFKTYEDLEAHTLDHHTMTEVTVEDNYTSETEFAGSYIEELGERDLIIPAPAPLEPEVDDDVTSQLAKDESCAGDVKDEGGDADDVIAKVMADNIFLLNSKKARRHRKNSKACVVCYKHFDRVGDLKRHLIEHVIRSTLSKTPVSKDGTLNITCEVCQAETFHKIDKYKAHLREHAKLTLYCCTFCDKSFSDSSNFSKHKKIHGVSYLQCDLCQRKFNSKKMIAQHMEYHSKNAPIQCEFCDRVFHFESMLNKHIKGAHTKEFTSRFRCRFCQEYFRSLKEKWDHEWSVHHIRKMIVDCLICGTKFRKYSDMKRHCVKMHDMAIPPAKKLLNRS